MRAAKSIALLGTIVMLGGILYALLLGDFATEGNRIVSMPWGIVSLIDLYTGFILFSGWIIYREKSVVSAILWVTLMLTLGFFTGALYTFLALQNSGGDWNRFWHGSRAKASLNLASSG